MSWPSALSSVEGKNVVTGVILGKATVGFGCVLFQSYTRALFYYCYVMLITDY